jgi:NADH-quinone oxidoreductase subunit J
MESPSSAGPGEHRGDELPGGDIMIEILFLLFAAIALGAAINVLLQKHVLYSALSLIVLLGSMSVLFLLLQAEFLAVINVIVYAGAIMVLFVFVIMLLNLPAHEDGIDQLRWLKFFGIPLTLFLLFIVAATVWNAGSGSYAEPRVAGTAEAIGRSLFTDYLLPFELTSLLILIALMGAVVFAKKDL